MNLILIDAVTNIFAFIGCLFYGINMLQYRNFDVRARRIFWLMAVVSCLFLVRCLAEFSGLEIFARILTVISLSLPFFILISVEGFMRRHANLWLKILTFASMSLGLVMLGIDSQNSDPYASIVAAIILIVTCSFCALWMKRRSVRDLSLVEQPVACIYSTSLICMIPLILSDFVTISNLDVRFGATGLLLGLFVLLRTTKDNTSLRQILCEILLMAVMSLPVAMLGLSGGKSLWVAVSLMNMTIALLAATGITARVFSIYIDGSRLKKIQQMADIKSSSLEGFLEELKAFFSFSVLQGDSLSIYDISCLRCAFGEHTVLGLRLLKDQRYHNLSVDAHEQIDHILSTHAASHAVMLDGISPRIFLFNMPPLGHEDDIVAQLKIVHKIAAFKIREEHEHRNSRT